tara:strand:- start:4916 stop:5176 length:261 start_codon:yes stop_codon:yes gene_type:complete
MDLMTDIFFTVKNQQHILMLIKKQKLNFIHILTSKNIHHMILLGFHTTKECEQKRIFSLQNINFLSEKDSENGDFQMIVKIHTEPF